MKQPFSEKHIQQWINDELSSKELGELYGLQRNSVVYRLHKMGRADIEQKLIENRNNNQFKDKAFKPSEVKTAWQLINLGKSCRQICELMKKDRKAVERLFHDLAHTVRNKTMERQQSQQMMKESFLLKRWLPKSHYKTVNVNFSFARA